ncbi:MULTISPECIES: caspase family protein [unclassified Bradyrhizobium]|uniref:caspase family protein n=1 Tax=unclassified Bradyrhizobium TaxID=2631580 RepID=UPI003396253B
MARKPRRKQGGIVDANDGTAPRFSRVVVVIVALENYRKPSNGDALPSVAFAHADADGIRDAVLEIFKHLPAGDVEIEVMKDTDASLIAVKDHLAYKIRTLDDDALFIFYYAGHGFHGAGGNRLSTYDSNRVNIGDTTLSMRDALLEPLQDSACKQALIFVDACAEDFRSVVQSRDIIGNLDAGEVREFLDSGWYLGTFLSCSPGEKSYPSRRLGHGIWTHFLLEALHGRAKDALTRDRWLTGEGLQNYLRQEVPRYITREMSIPGSQTPQAILSSSNSFRIHYVPRPPAVQADAALAGIRLRNNGEFLEGTETGAIRSLNGFQRGYHKVPDRLSDSAGGWCNRLLADTVAEELQTLYQQTREVLGLKRKDLRKEEDTLDAPAFRYIVETGQNPEEPSEYYITRRLELRQGWPAHREALEQLFNDEFQQLVVEFESMEDSFDDLVDRLEEIRDEGGGEVDDDDRHQRVSYSRDGATFTFDLAKRRLEIRFGRVSALQLVDAAQRFQLGTCRSSPMLATPSGRRPANVEED